MVEEGMAPDLSEKSERDMAMLCHLLGLFGLLGPIIIWILKKDESPAVDYHGRESINFQISILIYAFAATLSAIVLIGFLLAPAVVVFNLVMVITGAMKTNKGEAFQYPLCLRIL